jgi:hypothetical protein
MCAVRSHARYARNAGDDIVCTCLVLTRSHAVGACPQPVDADSSVDWPRVRGLRQRRLCAVEGVGRRGVSAQR